MCLVYWFLPLLYCVVCIDIPAPVKLAAHSLHTLSQSWAYVPLRLLIGYQIHLHFSNHSGLMLGGREILLAVCYDGGRKRSRCLKHLITGVLPVGSKQLNANFCVQRCHRHGVIRRDSPLSHPLLFRISLFSNYHFFSPPKFTLTLNLFYSKRFFILTLLKAFYEPQAQQLNTASIYLPDGCGDLKARQVLLRDLQYSDLRQQLQARKKGKKNKLKKWARHLRA